MGRKRQHRDAGASSPARREKVMGTTYCNLVSKIVSRSFREAPIGERALRGKGERSAQALFSSRTCAH